MLIDSAGCPTDVQIMGFVSKPTTEKSGVANSRILEIPFDVSFGCLKRWIIIF